jgi:hypothetical protein
MLFSNLDTLNDSNLGPLLKNGGIDQEGFNDFVNDTALMLDEIEEMTNK